MNDYREDEYLYECPRCGQDEATLIKNGSGSDSNYEVICNACDECTDRFKTEDEAIDAWNKGIMKENVFKICPKCNRYKVYLYRNVKKNIAYIECETCGFETEVYKTEEEAIEAWNKLSEDTNTVLRETEKN